MTRPRQTQSALLISPFHNLLSYAPSRKENQVYDLIDGGACFRATLDYIGAELPIKYKTAPSFNPLLFLGGAYPNGPPIPGLSLFKETRPFEAEQDGRGIKLLGSPYVNPCECKDEEWWKEACPGAGRTMVTWGELISPSLGFALTRDFSNQVEQRSSATT